MIISKYSVSGEGNSMASYSEIKCKCEECGDIFYVEGGSLLEDDDVELCGNCHNTLTNPRECYERFEREVK